MSAPGSGADSLGRLEGAPLVVLDARSGAGLRGLHELMEFRGLFWVLASRDVRVRYKQTVLGVLWAVLQPVLTMVIFSAVFGHVAKLPSDGLPYPVFVYAGLLPWTFFSNAVGAAAGSLVGSSHLVSKVYFPRLIVPFASVGPPVVDFLVSTGVLLVLMAVYGTGVTWSIALLPLLVLLLVLSSLGIGTLLSALTVSYRDFRFVTPFLLQIWLYVTPVVYPTSLVPSGWRWLLLLNPMTGIVDGFRAAFLGSPLDPWSLLASGASGTLLFLLGVLYFRRVEARFADVI